MNTFLLTWSKWIWSDLSTAIEQTRNGVPYPHRWSVHAHRQMKVGDRVLLDKKVGTKVNLDGEILLFVHVDDILAVYGV